MTALSARIRLGVAILGLLLAPGTGLAQTRILSGEHDDFSRLAIVFAQPTEWRTEPVEGGWRVAFTPPPGPIDLSRVFDLIPRDRIEAVRQDPEDGTIFIASTCECHLDAFDAGRGVLALDVKDGPSPDGAADRRAVPAVPQPLADLQDTAPSASLPPGLTIRTTTRTRHAGARVPRPAPDGAPSDSAAAAAPYDVHALALDRARAEADLEAALRGDMQRAAEAGLVDLREEEPTPATSVPANAAAEEDTASASADLPRTRNGGPQRQGGPERNIDVRTSLDPARDRHPQAVGYPPCPPRDMFSFLESRTAPELLSALPGLRAGLVDDAGAVDERGARRLAEAWLALGFGAEATSLTRETMGPGPLTDIYGSLARILDDGRDAAPSVWSGLQRCPSPAALWAFLGHDPGPGAPPTDTGALQRAFFSLPTHLRLQIGPDLVALLRLRGLPAAAAAIEGNLEVLQAPPAAAADRSPDGGAAESAPAALENAPEILPGQSLARVDALLAEARARLSRDRMPAAGDLDLAEALAREHAGTERGDRLAGLAGLRHLADGELAAAAARLLRPDRPEDPEWRAILRDAAAATISAMSDADLLELALHPRGGDLMGTLSPSQTTAIADRLTDMGFPRLAMAALARIEVASSPDARRSRARAALADGDAAQALALVAGEESPGAARLRGTALSQLGSHALAAAAFAAAGDTGRAAQEAWLSGDSEAIARFGTEEQRGLAASLLPRVDAAAAPLPVPSAAGPGALRPGPDRAPPGATPVGEGADASRQAASGDGGPPLGVERPDAARLPTDGGPPSLSAARSLVDDSSALRESLQQLLGERAGAP